MSGGFVNNIRFRMVVLDGKRVSNEIIARLKHEFVKLSKKSSLAVVVVGEDAVVRRFINQKRKIADELGVDFRVYDYPGDISTNELRKHIATIVHDADPTGIVVQLPLPSQINTQYILNAIPAEKDIDVLSARAVGNFSVGKSSIYPPVVGAIRALLEEYQIVYQSKQWVVVGAGILVGKPAAAWLLREKITFSVVDEQTPDISPFVRAADIIVSGVGKPGLIMGEMVRDGVIVFDAGTSESAGKLVGDVDFDSVSGKASFITPVPGGIGPLTVAMIYQNLLMLAKQR